jgi:hypothetical protein
MAWTERRKRKVLAVVDGVVAFGGCIGFTGLILGLCRWVQGNDNHNYWMAGSVKMPLQPIFHVLQTIIPESLALLGLLVTVPMAVGYLSYACDESLFTKVCRWLMVLAALGVIAAATPLISFHGCICGSGYDEGWFDHGWDEVFLPGLALLFLAWANRKAHHRWSSEAPLADPAPDSPP